MNRRRKLALEEEIRTAIAMYADGDAIRVIASRFGVSNLLVRKRLIEAGVTMRPTSHEIAQDKERRASEELDNFVKAIRKMRETGAVTDS
jgi:transposase